MDIRRLERKASVPGGMHASPSPKRSRGSGKARRSLAFSGSSKSTGDLYSDRFIPSRSAGNLLAEYSLLRQAVEKRARQARSGASADNANSNTPNSNAAAGHNASSAHDENSFAHSTYEAVLLAEMMGAEYGEVPGPNSPVARRNGGPGSPNAAASSSAAAAAAMGGGGSPAPSSPSMAAGNPLSPTRRNLLRYKSSPRREKACSPQVVSAYSLSPLSARGKRLLQSPQKAPRKISKVPFKVLEAPSIQDDFYLNLVDWSSQNVLSVGLGSSVYLWNAQTSQVTRLADLGQSLVTSVSWMQRGTHLAIGDIKGAVEIWDVAAEKRVRTLKGHKMRVGTLSWNGNILSSGSRDRMIYHRDVRAPAPYIRKLTGHKQEVCGLKWSWDGQYLASGGNDNRLLIWSATGQTPIQRYQDHTAAVKAIAWSPHQRGLLASGGGTADRCIKFRNVLNNTSLHSYDTGSQVCNLAWSKNVNELCSTHGYSQNQVVIWSYPSMTPLTVLTGHTTRVLYLAVSPDGQTIVTGAGDETLRFWNVFPAPTGKAALGPGNLVKGNLIR